MPSDPMVPYRSIDFAALPAAACPCGTARRALFEDTDVPFTLHRTQICIDAQLHYHRRLTETYYVLDCDPTAEMQLNDERVPLRPGSCILIRPGTRHRVVGRAEVLIVVYPKFDPHDEWFD